MMFVDLNDHFSCHEFDRAIVQLKAVENIMRKTTRLVCDVTLPATGVDKTDNLMEVDLCLYYAIKQNRFESKTVDTAIKKCFIASKINVIKK